MERFRIPLSVRPGDIDDLGHVNNTVYLRWVQEVATAHWRSRAPDDALRRVAWVVLRHEIDYLRPAGPGEELVAETWVGGAGAVRFRRHTLIRRKDGAELARAVSVWCPVSAETGRPVRVSPEVRERFSAAPADDGA